MKKNIVVTVSVLGETLNTEKDVKPRVSFLDNIKETVKSLSQEHSIELVMFPGGYFFSEQNIGELSEHQRIKHLLKKDFSKACIKMAKELDQDNPGIKIVAGVDTSGINLNNKCYGGDQLVVAYDKKGIVGLGRKVFPVAEDVDGKKHPPMIIYEQDFSSSKRVIKLSSGKKALLCSCYDMFGIAARGDEYTNKLSKIKILKNKEGFVLKGTDLQERRKSCFNSWKKLIEENKISFGISAIHRFNKPGRDIFWQRHGIASASASLDGRLALGAAHYKEELPDTIDQTSLASKNVSKKHLSSGSLRKAHSLKPITLHTVRCDKNPKLQAVIRSFII
jgi:hypothetical protein